MFMLVGEGELLERGEEVVCKTWMRTRVWPLERSVSAAHLRACLLPFLSFSTATATNPFPFPLLLIIDSFVLETHIYLSILSSFLFPQLCNFFPNYFFICLVIQCFLLFNIPWLIIKVCMPQRKTISRKPSPHFMDSQSQISFSPPPIMGQQKKE